MADRDRIDSPFPPSTLGGTAFAPSDAEETAAPDTRTFTKYMVFRLNTETAGPSWLPIEGDFDAYNHDGAIKQAAMGASGIEPGTYAAVPKSRFRTRVVSERIQMTLE